MIEGFEPSALIIVNLVNPKEKFFGVLTALSAAGITLRGINLDSFDDWLRQLAKKDEPNLDLITMFVPLFRVERPFASSRTIRKNCCSRASGTRLVPVGGIGIAVYPGSVRKTKRAAAGPTR